MRVFIEIFLMCIMAQPLFCRMPVQPLGGAILAENAKVDNKSTILSLINEAGNCTAYAVFKSEQKYEQLKEYCERPFPHIPHKNEFLSYEVVLCMVLYDTAQRVCEEERQGVTKVIQSSSNFSCDTMIKGVPKKSAESTKQWVTIFKAKFENISNCKEKCIQDNLINPVCEYILKANALMPQAQVSSNISAGASHAKNVEHHGYSQGHGKVKTITNSDEASEKVAVYVPSAGGTDLPVVKNGSQNTEHVDDKVAVSDNSTGHEDVDRAKANGNSTHSGSENNVGNNVKQQADAKDNNTRNDTNKQAHNTSSSMQNNGKHAINSNNQSGEVTPQNAAVSLPKHTERTPEGDKYDDSTGKGVASDSKSAMAAQPENKNSAAVDAPDPEIQNQNVDNKESVVSTDDNDKVQDTGSAVKITSDDEDQEENINVDRQGEQSEQIPKETEAHQEEVETGSTALETGSTAQFNQLGDVDDSHFYAYFMTMVVICIIGYLVFHNKQKILALALEGRSRRGTRRRPNTSAYRKLDSNLEEAVTSTCSTSVTHVIY